MVASVVASSLVGSDLLSPESLESQPQIANANVAIVDSKSKESILNVFLDKSKHLLYINYDN